MYTSLLELLSALDGVSQDRRYHPEGDALYHSLQVFQLAQRETGDRVLWAAALLHDVGKAVSSSDHDEVGADLLDGLVCPRVVWLVRHHLDLLRNPGATKRKLRNTKALVDLGKLRRWDVGGRSPTAWVHTPSDALSILLNGDLTNLSPSGDAAYFHDEQEVQ
ncbi:MAG: HD domain-containing protein [Polyangiaceae bacterium]|nr:HD domain-containing protein [Polyangiaceae bacterium]